MLLTVKDAARFLNVSEKTIYRWVKNETIPAYRINDQIRFNRVELLECATSRKIQVSPDFFNDETSEPENLPTLSEALKAGGIAYRLSGNDKASSLRSVVDVMKIPDDIDPEFLFQVLLAREALSSTGVGDGIAIPHVRTPLVLHVTRPMVTLCFLENPVQFGALDGQPVSILFVLITPTVKTHLHLISRISFVLHNAEFKACLKRQASRDELTQTLEKAEARLTASAPGP